MFEALDRLCRLCGRFRDGHYVPKNLRAPLTGEEISPTWERLYLDWHRRKAPGPKGPPEWSVAIPDSDHLPGESNEGSETML
jgi:hypothetical protein